MIVGGHVYHHEDSRLAFGCGGVLLWHYLIRVCFRERTIISEIIKMWSHRLVAESVIWYGGLHKTDC